MKYKPGKEAELELEFLSNSSPAGETLMLATNTITSFQNKLRHTIMQTLMLHHKLCEILLDMREQIKNKLNCKYDSSGDMIKYNGNLLI